METCEICRGIEKALVYESTGQVYYMKCAASTTHPIGRRMFEACAKESHVNRDRLDRLYRTYYKTEYAEYSEKNNVSKHRSPYEEIPSGNMDESENLLPVLEHACSAGLETASLYKELSEGVTDKTLKRFFLGLADDKTKNVQIMRTQYEYIKGTGCYTEYK